MDIYTSAIVMLTLLNKIFKTFLKQDLIMILLPYQIWTLICLIHTVWIYLQLYSRKDFTLILCLYYLVLILWLVMRYFKRVSIFCCVGELLVFPWTSPSADAKMSSKCPKRGRKKLWQLWSGFYMMVALTLYDLRLSFYVRSASNNL